jgi:thiol-disulfide isomerase/thioredoxin
MRLLECRLIARQRRAMSFTPSFNAARGQVRAMRAIAGLIVGASVVLPSVHAASAKAVWHNASGGTVEGQLVDVFGPFVAIKAKRTNAVVPMEALTDEEISRVADFLERNPERRRWSDSKSTVAGELAGCLAILKDGKSARFEPGDRPEPLFYLVYFSAGWCGPCHRFTPELVKSYAEFQQKWPGLVEVIFVSSDQSAAEQQEYAKEMKMPWPMLRYGMLGSAPSIESWAGDGIPCLVAVTPGGVAVFHSYRGQEYVGPQSVVDSVKQVLPMLQPGAGATRLARHRLALAERLARGSHEDLPAKPYLLSCDATKFAGIDLPERVTLECRIDERGHILDTEVKEETVSRDLANVIQSLAQGWLFLPPVIHGHAQAATVELPVNLKEIVGSGA